MKQDQNNRFPSVQKTTSSIGTASKGAASAASAKIGAAMKSAGGGRR